MTPRRARSGRARNERRLVPLVPLALLAGCESAPSLDTAGTDMTEVHILGDGFCRFEGERIPVEEFILTMRLRLRRGGDDARKKTFVHLRVDEAAGGSAQADLDRVIDELYGMGVRQIRYL